MQNLQHTGPWATQNSNVRYISEFFTSSFRLKYCTFNFLCCFHCPVKTAFVLIEALWFLRKFSNNTTRKMIFPPQSLVNYYIMHSINSHIEIPYQGSWPPGLSSPVFERMVLIYFIYKTLAWILLFVSRLCTLTVMQQVFPLILWGYLPICSLVILPTYMTVRYMIFKFELLKCLHFLEIRCSVNVLWRKFSHLSEASHDCSGVILIY